MRILGVDPGNKNIGIALSDPTGTLASPLTIIRHISRSKDAAAIVSIAVEQNAELVVVGQALDDDGYPTVSGRSASRLAAAIRKESMIPVVLWDESNSTQNAHALPQTRPYRKQKKPLDDLAAAIILQSYLDAQDAR